MNTVISNTDQYESYLSQIEQLIDANPSEGSRDFERLQLLSLAVDEYERNRFVFQTPTPVEAIRFRMEEQGLKQSDLIPYIGSKSKVSEILAGKRNLTVPMIRALSTHLGIPASVLVSEDSAPAIDSKVEIDWRDVPWKELSKRKWISQAVTSQPNITSLVAELFAPIGGSAPSALWRKPVSFRTGGGKTIAPLIAWLGRAMALARDKKASRYDQDSITPRFLQDVVRLSSFSKGPALVPEFLAEHGIKFVILEALSGTKLDGACFVGPDKNPIVAITLRYDRLDYFWFTLLHELAHVLQHLSKVQDVFLDELEIGEGINSIEKQADATARNALIPRAVWKRSDAFIYQTKDSVLQLASDLKIHPSIVAGMLRHDTENYQILPELLGQGDLRKLFEEELGGA